MTILEQRMYRNPLDILIDEENKTCRGCVHQHTATAFGKSIKICLQKDSKGKRRNHGKRCKDYMEVK